MDTNINLNCSNMSCVNHQLYVPVRKIKYYQSLSKKYPNLIITYGLSFTHGLLNENRHVFLCLEQCIQKNLENPDN